MMQRIIDSATRVQNNLDNPGLAEVIMENELLPRIREFIKEHSDINVDDGTWILKSTSAGFLTLIDISSGRYMHSGYDPMHEAYDLAGELFDNGMTQFNFFGAGLGYLPYQMWRRTGGSINVSVYETDQTLVDYALSFGPLGLIPENKLKIYVECDREKMAMTFMNTAVENSYISPYMQQNLSGEYGGLPSQWIVQLNTHHASKHARIFNAEYNKQTIGRYYNELKADNFSKEWVVVAAGPSLGENLDFLRESVGRRTIIAVNTCIPKLEALGIKPDLYTVCDPYEPIVSHIRGHEEATEDIPLLADAASYWEFVELYRGPKYLIPVSDELETVKRDKAALCVPDWYAGGTVTSVAIDAACIFGAETVYIIGMDLAYPGGAVYTGTSGEKQLADIKDAETVRSNDGSIVPSAKTFIAYGEHIRRQIQNYPRVTFWNLSKHGMYISGMRKGAWWEDGPSVCDDPQQWFDRLRSDSFLNWKEKYYLFRQFTDRFESSALQEVMDGAKSCLEDIFSAMTYAGSLISEVRIQSGKALKVILTSDTSTEENDGAYAWIKQNHFPDDRGILIINTRERLSGEPVYMRDAQKAPISKLPDDSDSITYMGHKYSYYQLSENMPDISFYMEILSFLAGQKGVEIIISDPFSLLGLMCGRTIE